MFEISETVRNQAEQIKLVIFDVDGVLTDGRLYFGDSGEEYKAFYAKDGLGMKMLMQSGVEVGIITARSAPLVTKRMENLGIQHLYQGQSDKVPAFEEMAHKLGLSHQQVSDAPPEVIQRAHWTTPQAGGLGGARNVCDLIMSAQGTLQAMIEGQVRGITN